MKAKFFIIIGWLFSNGVFAQKTPFEKGNGNQTTTYQECISFYKSLASAYKNTQMIKIGLSDENIPMYLFLIGDKSKNKPFVFINNGIHPGEPEGIDASMMLARDLLSKPENALLLTKVNIGIIPVFNVGGSENRGCCSRANQNGPEEYGFRGTENNLDLNRDFAKQKSLNTQNLCTILSKINPDIFIDTHTSNGADYPYVLTYIETQYQKLSEPLGSFMHTKFTPQVVENLQKKGLTAVQYVNTIKETPDSGIAGFLETARYTTGYNAMFNTIGYTVETHMLKPFSERVNATYQFILEVINQADKKSKELLENRKIAIKNTELTDTIFTNFEINITHADSILFNGFEAEYKKSEVTQKERLFYNRYKPWTKNIAFYNDYKPKLKIVLPKAWIIPQQWRFIENLLAVNGVIFERLRNDTLIPVSIKYIETYQTIQKPFEGQYLHYETKTRSENQEIHFRKGDILVFANQPSNRFLAEVFTPEASDSWFNWNYFDAILSQKEYFSNYVFEDTAAELLSNDSSLKKELEAYKANNLKVTPQQLLDWVYKHSLYYEKSHMRYPVYRLELNSIK